MMHGNILRYFRGKKEAFFPSQKGARVILINKARERERKKERRRGWLILLGVFIVAFSGE